LTVGGWFLSLVGVGVTVFAAVAFHAAYIDRRRPVRDSQGRWQAPRRYHNGWGEWEW
jgi:hypothetical protein